MKIIHAAIVAALVGVMYPLASFADIVSDIQISQNGRFSAHNIVIMQKAGQNIFARATWGQAFIRITMLTNASTTIQKSHGEAASVSDLKEGDLLDVEGMLSTGADGILIVPSFIRDGALQTAPKTFSGNVVSVNKDASTFMLARPSLGTVTVRLSATAVITKGARTIPIQDLAAGDKIVSTAGTYDYSSNMLTATAVEVYQDKKLFLPRNFQGTLKSISGASLPTTLGVMIDGTEYTVYLGTASSVLRNSRKPATLTRFVVGDTVRVYGSIRPAQLTEIDAEIVRDTAF